MTCPFCSAVLPDEDLFCEECGKPLKNPDAPLCLCGAPDSDLDEDGFCLQCGKRCRPRPGEHVEIELSPDFAAVSDRGLRHPRNEDRAAIEMHGGRKLLVVCDGVSTSENAAKASETACDIMKQNTNLKLALEEAQKAVATLGNGGESAPATTAVAALVTGRDVQIAWIGDSRAYWIAATGSRQLTSDHSWMNEVVAAGEMTPDEARRSPQAHGITRWLGADSGGEPDFTQFTIPGPGYLVLCTDGLWNYADAVNEFSNLVLKSGNETALQTATRLVAFANQQGGHDNISVALLRIHS